jgi:hypothetical protein
MSGKIMITLGEIHKHNPCADGWRKLLKAKGKTVADGDQFPLSDILDTNDLDDCLWALRCTPESYHGLWRKFAVWAARQVEHLMEDERSKTALDVAWRHSNGEATDEELAAAGDAARAAAWAAARDAAGDAARAAAWDAAGDAARAAAWDAAGDAARAAAWDAARAAARDAARDAAWAAAGDAAGAAQAKKLKQILNAGEWAE